MFKPSVRAPRADRVQVAGSRTRLGRARATLTDAGFGRIRLVLLLGCLLTAGACQQTARDVSALPVAAAPITVRQSPNDQRAYRYRTLANGLRLLLVSDPDTDKAAASLVVFRGSHHEPAAYPGLAHFLEHMLFIGTRKYPEVDAYQQFIGQHGGSSNAYTAGDHTNYFFDIQPDYFEAGMDRFAQFFIAPLLAADYVEREKNAVHSEYQMQLRADNWRASAVLDVALSPNHPEARFNIGSLETLGDGVDGALRTFLETNYSADQMALVALSNEPLDALEGWVTPLFEAIPNRNIGPAPATAPLFEPGQLPATLTFRSIKDGHSIGYNFPVPAATPRYRAKADQYVANLLGHEGEGSLHQVLRARGYIESLAAGTYDVDERHGLLSIDIELTPAGYAARETVTDLVFDWIDSLRAESPAEWRHAEQARVAALGFQFQEKSSATGFVYQTAPALMRYPAVDVLAAPYLMDDFDPQLIKTYLDALTPDNVLMTVSGPDVSTNAEERWFGVPYRLDRGPIQRAAATAALSLPTPNPFLPERLDLVPDDPAGPVPIQAAPGLALWIDRDTAFGTPRANLRLSLGLEGGMATARDSAFAALYTALVEDSLSAAAYPAVLAGLGYGLGQDGAGITLDVRGYDDRQPVLLDLVLDRLRTLTIDPKRFAVLQDQLLRDWANYRDERPYTQAIGALGYLLVSDQWPPEALAAALADRTPADLATWRDQRLARVNVQGLLHGNARPAEVDALARTIAARLPLADFPRRSGVVRAVDDRVRYPLDIEHQDAALVMYVQDTESSLPARARTALAASVIRQAYFTSLRTEQQLGYVVAANNQTLRDRGGLVFIVQSPVASAADIETRTRAFIDEQIAAVAALPETEFEQFRAGLLSQLLERDRNLAQRSDRLWRDLDLGFTRFDSREQIAASIRTLTRDDIVTYLRGVSNAFEDRVLLAYSPGKFEAVPTGGRRVRDAVAFKATAVRQATPDGQATP